MNAISFSNPNLFLKGVAEIVVTDPSTGNIVAYDNVASESAVNSSVNMGEIAGGLGNPVVMMLPDTARITGSLTSQAFSLEQRALAVGSTVEYNAIVPVCETISPSGSTLTVSMTPAKSYEQPETDEYAWCYVREHGSNDNDGTAYQLAIGTKQVVGFTPEGLSLYDVTYFTQSTGAKVLPIPATFNPAVISIRVKYAVYAKQNNSVSNGTLAGYLYCIVPRAQFSGDIGIAANQTTNATTAYDWTALSPDNPIMACSDCSGSVSNMAYYVYAPCGNQLAGVQSLILIGGNSQTVIANVGEIYQIPVKYYMDNSTVLQPNYSDLQYSYDGTTATASSPVTLPMGTLKADGTITFSDGTVTSPVDIVIRLAKPDGSILSTTLTLTVGP